MVNKLVKTDENENESDIEPSDMVSRSFEYLFTVWLIIGPPLLIYLLYYFRNYYRKHKHIYSSIFLLVLLYIIFHYVIIIIGMMYVNIYVKVLQSF